MPISLRIDGQIWEFSTAREADEFRRLMSGQPEQPETRPAAPARRRARRVTQKAKAPATDRPRFAPARVASKAATTATLSSAARRLLEVVRAIPADGMESPDFAAAIGVGAVNEIPVKMMNIGKELRALGYLPEQVISKEKRYRKGRGVSVFRPGPRIDEALQEPGNLFAVAR
jgi:hypothetical protein